LLPQRLVLFVEGKGDKTAVPTLTRRVLAAAGATDALFVDPDPFVVRGVGKLIKNNCADWHRSIFAMKEFEAWLVAGVESLRGLSLADGRGIVPGTATPPDSDIEAKRDAKGVLREIIPGYDQSLDQAVLAAKVDLDTIALRCRSFRRLQSAVMQLAEAVRAGRFIVSPGIDIP
jgi:hypothetical protein